MKPYTVGPEGCSLQNDVTRLELEVWIYNIQHISKISDLNLFSALIYLRRLMTEKPYLPFCWINVHRLYLVACILVSKFLDDVTYKNKDWATIGGKFFPLPEVSG